nr:LysR family transcriptional regulator [Prevotella sp.]
MELRLLKYFVKVAETQNFSEACRELFISQSTLSQQISQLEKELCHKLFLRNSHSVQITEAGKELLPYARKTIEDAQLCIEHLQDLNDLLTGELNIGVTHSFSSIMTDTLLGFLRQHPGVKLNICYKTMEELMNMLERCELDFVLAFKPSHQNEKIESHVLFNNHLAIIVGENHQLANRVSVKLDDLGKYSFVLPAKGLQARNTFQDVLRKKPHNFNIKLELNNVNVLLRIVKESNYITVLSESAIIGETGLKAIRLDEQEANLEGCIHLLKNSYIKNSAQVFLRMLTQSTEILRSSALSDII